MTISTRKGGAGLALLLLCAANFLDAMDVSTIGVALPAIQAELGMKATSLQWAVSAYVLGYGGFLLALSQIPLGVGYAMTYPSVQVAALSDVEEDKSGLASGLLFASFQIGGGIVLAAASAVFAAAPGFGWDPYFAGITFVATLSVAVALVAALGPRTSARREDIYQAAE